MRVVFKNPDKNDIVLFDEAGSDNIKNMVFYDIDCTVVYARKEKLHITLPILTLMIKNSISLIKGRALDLKDARKSSFVGYIYKIYLFSVLEYIGPKVVLTWIYNSRFFHWLSRTYKNAAFYAVQHGISSLAKRTHCSDRGKDVEKPKCFSPDKMSFPVLFSFGQYDKDIYKENGHDVDKFIVSGPLKGNFYMEEIAGKNVRYKFDVCLVSQYVYYAQGQKLSTIAVGFEALHNLVKGYIEEKGLSCCVAMRSVRDESQQREESYFRGVFGDSVEIIKQDQNNLFSTYDAMHNSSIVVALNSTAAYEAFGWGQKVLFCNLSGDDYYQLPLPEICQMNENNYELFKQKMDYLIQIEQAEYLKQVDQGRKYLMKYDDKPAHKVIREEVLKCLNEEKGKV